MSLNTIADLSEDQPLLKRIVACVAQEGEADPEGWVRARAWKLAATPGWAEAYESAQLNGDPEPGRRNDVITNLMILTRVQQIRNPAGLAVMPEGA